MADVPSPQSPLQPMRPQGAGLRRALVLIVPLTMYLTSLSLFATAIGLLVMQGDINDAVDEGLLGHSSSAAADFAAGVDAMIAIFSLKVTAWLYLLLAAFHLVLGPLDYKGKRSARILGLILAISSLGCCGIGGIVMRAFAGMSPIGEPYNDQISVAVLEATPTWLTALQWISLSLLIVGSMLVIILLAVQDSREQFHAEEPAHSPDPDQPPDSELDS